MIGNGIEKQACCGPEMRQKYAQNRINGPKNSTETRYKINSVTNKNREVGKC